MQRVEVDQNCLTTGRIQSPNYCPVAIALERAGFGVCSVGDENIATKCDDPANSKMYTIDKEISNFIHRFDNQDPVEPFVVIVDHEKQEIRKE